MVQPRIGDGETVGMMVRMSSGLRDRIKAAAESNGRSQNSEIVATLGREYPAPEEYMDIKRLLSLTAHVQAGTSRDECQRRAKWVERELAREGINARVFHAPDPEHEGRVVAHIQITPPAPENLPSYDNR